MAVDPDSFRTAMSRFPVGVAVITTHDQEGRPVGFTASSFCSVSLAPPLVLVCVARTASSFRAFDDTETFAINMLRSGHDRLARRFATRGADKFADGHWRRTARGSVVLDDALAGLECTVRDRHDGGDHVILVGQVEAVVGRGQPGGGDPAALYVNRGFTRPCSGNGACLHAAPALA
ncbi:MAG TPA: flavin reductase family protein [Kineosporiaceae bacterium]